MDFRITLADHQRPSMSLTFSFQSETSPDVPEDLAKAAVGFLDHADDDFLTGMHVLSVEGGKAGATDLKRYTVLAGDRPHSVAAAGPKEAEIATALHHALFGIPADRLPVTAYEVASAVSRLPASVAQARPAIASFPLADWRVREGESGSLTAGQTEAWKVDVVEDAYGIDVVLSKDGQEHSVSVEIDRGCPGITVTPDGVGNMMARIRTAEGAMQIDAVPESGEAVRLTLGEAVEPSGDDIVQQHGEPTTAAFA